MGEAWMITDENWIVKTRIRMDENIGISWYGTGIRTDENWIVGTFTSQPGLA
jgi:hypothetical protein